jgi:hypothetical protein
MEWFEAEKEWDGDEMGFSDGSKLAMVIFR